MNVHTLHFHIGFDRSRSERTCDCGRSPCEDELSIKTKRPFGIEQGIWRCPDCRRIWAASKLAHDNDGKKRVLSIVISPASPEEVIAKAAEDA